jgi:thiol-disulfide isomerase/thioredoxin
MNTHTLLSAVMVAFALSVSPAAHAAPAVGDLPPNLLGLDLEGERVQVSAFAGKAMVITFWATWCPYCLKELPVLHNIQTKIGKERLQVVAINTEDRAVFRKAVHILANLNVLHARDSNHDSQDAYGVSGLPHMVIVGRDGKIVAIHKGYGESALPRIAEDINRALASGG